MNHIETSIIDLCRRAKNSSRSLVAASTCEKNGILNNMAELLNTKKTFIQQENAKDIDNAIKKGISAAMIERLSLSDRVIAAMVKGLHEVVALPDPVGKVEGMGRRPNGLLVGRMHVPLGVIGMIYESRPNVTVDAAALCVKAGNSVILRGGSEAIHSNMALAQILQEAMAGTAIHQEAVQVVPFTERDAVQTLLAQKDFIDLIIPRGGEGLIRFVAENSMIPVLKHYKGVCHIYVDKCADITKGEEIIHNGKVQRPGVCNALEGILVHEEIAKSFLPQLAKSLAQAGVELRGCPRAMEISPEIKPATATDWGSEFLDLIMCVKVVAGYEEAREYIESYGSQHTEGIITEDYSLAQRFIREIDASAVVVNASTRFNDGGQLGLGAEIGISTTKLHAYGPMGLEELTTRKFIVFGEGQIREQ